MLVVSAVLFLWFASGYNNLFFKTRPQQPWANIYCSDTGPPTGRRNSGPSMGRRNNGPSTGRRNNGPSAGRIINWPYTGRMIDWPNMGQTDRIMAVNRLELESSVHGLTINRPYLMML